MPTTKQNITQLSKDNFEMIDFTNLGVVKEKLAAIPKFVVGDIYTLDSIACDGFEMEHEFYKLIGCVDKYQDTVIDSVIVKKIHYNDNDRIYTLSKNDCKCLNIKYEKGLQLFPTKMNWVRYKETVRFNQTDMSTNPLSDIDHTIRKMLIKIHGFANYDSKYIITPNNDLIKASDLNSQSFIVENLLPLSFTDTFSIINKKLCTRIVYPKGVRFPYNNCISDDNAIYLLVSLTIANSTKILDGKCGVPKKYLEHISPYDMFSISWYNSNPLSIVEYETHKKRVQEEKIKKEHIKRKRLQREKEKRDYVFNALTNDVWEMRIDDSKWEKAHNVNEIDEAISEYINDIDKTIDTVMKTMGGMLNIIK